MSTAFKTIVQQSPCAVGSRRRAPMQAVVDAPSETGAVTTVEASDGVPAAIALLGGDGHVERATTRFLERVAADEALRAPIEDDLGRIIDGECEELTVTLDGVTAELTAVVGPGGRRCAVLMIPLDSREPTGDLSDLPLEEPIDSSPAIVWLKDLDGRYLRVNRQYEEQLGTNAGQVC